jgi:acetylornithine deacetylase/succinyl-diaminopimelate desuccinylase-like protein
VWVAGASADGGETFALNVIPNHCEAGFDIRIPAGRDLNAFENEIKEMLCKDLDNVEYEKVIERVAKKN